MNQQIIIYQSEDGKIVVDTLMQDDNLWLSQKTMAQLFECTPENVLLHLKNIYETGELEEISTAKDFLVVQKEGSREVKRNIKHYNLDAIISVGYRVNSIRGTQFRIWATQRLKEYLLQGFSLNETKLKTGKTTEYFDKLQSKLREIRLSERVFYQKVKDIYTTAVDYDSSDEQTPMTMADWIEQLDLILKMNKKELLTHYGKISHALAKKKAEKEWDKFKAAQRKIEKAESLKELEADLKNLGIDG